MSAAVAGPPLVGPEAVAAIVQEVFAAMVDDGESLVSVLPDVDGPWTDPVSSWVAMSGPETGRVLLAVRTERAAAEAFARVLMRARGVPLLPEEDLWDALGELANVVGGNVKALLPSPAALELPGTGVDAPLGPDAVLRDAVSLDWRGWPLALSVWGVR